jgi:hypothetical protein
MTPRAEATNTQAGIAENAGTQAQAGTNAKSRWRQPPTVPTSRWTGALLEAPPHDRRPRRRSRNQRQEKWLQALGTKNQDQYWETDIAADLEADVKQEQKTEAAVTVQTPTDHPAALRETTGATPAETLGTLSLTSSPYGAEIYSDSVFVGKTSATLRLKPGRHNILLMIIDYKNWSREITADAGAKPDLAAAMEKSN